MIMKEIIVRFDFLRMVVWASEGGCVLGSRGLGAQRDACY